MLTADVYLEHLLHRRLLRSYECQMVVIKAAAFVSDRVVLRHPLFSDADDVWRTLAGVGGVAPTDTRNKPELFDAARLDEELRELDANWHRRLSEDLRSMMTEGILLTGTQVDPPRDRREVSFLTRQSTMRLFDPAAEAWWTQLSAELDTGPKWLSPDDIEEIEWIRSRQTATNTLATTVLSIAPLYILRCAPHLFGLRAEEVLSTRSKLNASLDAFRSNLTQFARTATTIQDDEDVAGFFHEVAGVLDHDYRELERQAKSSRLVSAAAERAPTVAAGLSAVGITFAANKDEPIIGLTALLSASLGQGLTVGLDLLKRRRALRRHPLYWRYRLNR